MAKSEPEKGSPYVSASAEKKPDYSVNTLKEISELKNEIMKLTNGMRSIRHSPDEKECYEKVLVPEVEVVQ